MLVSQEKYKAVTDALATATNDVKTLKEQEVSLKANAEMGKTYLSLKREEVERLYKANAGETADEAVVNLIKKADNAELDGLLKQYVKDGTGKFSGRCKSCGSGEFEFRSTFATPEEGITVPAKQVMTFGDLYAQSANETTPSQTINIKTKGENTEFQTGEEY